ncbi:MAG: ABC transporter permease subunit [Chloroflexi bacterium]|nr:ABC transporter permease subunit [Chloroflexota bacterium]
MSTARTGEVFDIGYQNYEGPREGRPRARRAVYKEGIRIALGIGRGGRAKIMPWAFIVAAGIPALVLALIAGTVDRLAGDFSAAIDLPSHGDYYGIASIIFLIFAAAVGPELLCPDRRDRVINLYLVRPITGTDYILARWAAFMTIMTLVTWLPQFILLTGLALGADNPATYLQDNWADTPRFLASGFVLAVYTTGIALAVASYTTRRAYAAAFIIGIFVISLPFATGLSQDIGGTAGEYLSLLNFSQIPILMNDIIFNENNLTTEEALSTQLPKITQIGWYAILTVVPFLVMWRRYWKLNP